MPESNGMGWGVIAGIVSAISAIIGLVIGGALALIGKGKRDERIEAGLARSHERLNEHEKIFATHDQALKNILSSFFNTDGEPRYITSIVCGEKEESCQKQIHEKISYMADNITRLERDVLAVSTSQADNLQTISICMILKKRIPVALVLIHHVCACDGQRLAV